MKKKIAILTVATLLTTTLFGQAVKKCDNAILKKTSDKLGKLSKENIRDFLLTFDDECKANTEFSEWSNELLFGVLYRQTEMALNVLETEEKNIKMGVILEDLASPINEVIELKVLIKRIDKVKIREQLKTSILDRLKTADAKIKTGK